MGSFSAISPGGGFAPRMIFLTGEEKAARVLQLAVPHDKSGMFSASAQMEPSHLSPLTDFELCFLPEAGCLNIPIQRTVCLAPNPRIMAFTGS